jgi:hypothetical protein
MWSYYTVQIIESDGTVQMYAVESDSDVNAQAEVLSDHPGSKPYRGLFWDVTKIVTTGN